MLHGISEPIVIWVNGDYYADIANKAIAYYQSKVNSEVNFQVVKKGPELEMMNDLENAYDLRPNMILTHSQYVEAFAQRSPEAFVSLDYYIGEDLFLPTIMSEVTCSNGLIYGYPAGNFPVALYYRKDLFEELWNEVFGEALPEEITWDQFREIGTALKDRGIKLLPPVTTEGRVLLKSTGKAFYDSDYSISPDGASEVMELLKDLKDEGLIYEGNFNNELIKYELAYGGIAAVIGDSSAIPRLKAAKHVAEESGLDQEWAAMKLPKSDTFFYDVNLGGAAWMVFDHSEEYNQNLVFDFLQKAFGRQSSLTRELAEEKFLIPALSYLSEWDEPDPDFANENLIMDLYSFQENMACVINGAHTAELNSYLDDLIRQIVNQDLNRMTAFNQLSQRCNEVYDEVLSPTEPYEPLIRLDRIEITGTPDKQVYQRGEAFDRTGITVTAYYDDENSFTVTNSVSIAPSTLGQNGTAVPVTISYDDFGVVKSAVITVTVIERELSGLRIVSQPNIMRYIDGEPFDETGMKINAFYTIGVEREIPLDRLTIGNRDLSGSGVVTISYSEDNKTATITLQVEKIARVPTGLRIGVSPQRYYYLEGETFDPSGMVVEAEYSNTAWLPVSDYYYKVDGAETNSAPALGSDDTSVAVYYKEPNQNEVTALVSVGVLRKGAADDKINQTKLDYSCGAGQAAVNVYTGRMTLGHPDVQIGANDGQIGISHIYKSDSPYLPIINTYMGNRWKLNIQQYLWGDNGYYLYLDAAGMSHHFNRYDDSVYYDTSGLGLTLTVEPDQAVISDQLGNRMYFTDNVLVKTVSNHGVTKIYAYENGKLQSVYDSRDPSNKLTFAYRADGLMEKIVCYRYNTAVKEIRYDYDEDGNLIHIKEVVRTEEKNVALFRYDAVENLAGRYLTYAVDMESGSALRFDYEKKNSRAYVQTVSTGVAGYSEIQAEDGAVTGYTVQDGVQTLGTDMKSRNRFEYMTDPSCTAVTNEKGIKVLYYLNQNGYTTSILEAIGTGLTDLRSLEKESGVHMIGNGTLPMQINQRNVYNMNTLEFDSSGSMMSGEFENVKFYRSEKCPDYQHYICSFWLYLNGSANADADVVITVKSGKYGSDYTDVGRAVLDGSAVDGWQLVNVPIQITNYNIQSIAVKFSGITSYRITDMTLRYAPSVGIRIGIDGNSVPLDEIDYIHYYKYGDSGFVDRSIGKSCYLSEKDLQATVLSLANKGSAGYYALSLCDQTVRIKVTDVKLFTKDNKQYTLYLNGSNRKAPFFQEIKSPDGNTRIVGELHYGKDYNGNSFSGICQHTRAQRGNKATETAMWLDNMGKILKETDEYGIETVYTYDSHGNLSTKTVQHPNTTEKIVYTATTSAFQKEETSATGSTTTLYYPPYGNVMEVTYQGKGENTSTPFDLAFEFNTFTDRISGVYNETIGDDMLGGNALTYDDKGRLASVAPTGYSAANGYGYQFEYDAFGDPLRYRLTEGTEDTGTLLVKKEIDYAEGTMVNDQYRADADHPDETITTFDQYGRTQSVTESSYGDASFKTTSFTRQGLWESPGAAEVTAMYDPYEDRTYQYSYDSSNQCTGYENEALSIKKTGENKVTYNLKNTAEYSTDLRQDINVIMEPRVTTTINSKNNSGDDLLMTNFRYDDLGRVKLKGILFWKNKNSFMRLTAKSEYLSGTYFKNKATTIVHDSDVEKIQYEATHEYNNRGLITGNTYRTTINSETETRYQTYTYDKANRLRTESGSSELAIYSYNPDGSIKEIQRGGNKSSYTYQKGRLTKIEDKIAGTVMNFSYDNLGNCTNFAGKALEWHRGSLLKKYGSNVTYQYNNQGVRFQKKVGSVETNYYLDGAKLLAEKRGSQVIRYLYDAEGVCGFVVDGAAYYAYVKDGLGNVIAIIRDEAEYATYRYDAWGNCTIVKDVGGIGTLNPIRWKSQYYDQESGFYYMNGRYYSPTTKQYLSAANVETTLANALTLYGLNLYLLCLTNPVSLGYNGYTIATNTELAYDPPSLSGWDIFVRGWHQFWQGWNKFWQTPVGTALAIVLFVAATVLAFACPAFMPYYLMTVGGLVISLGVGATINGFRSMSGGGDFWEGFANYINENWAQDVAVGMALAMVSFGISTIASSVCNAGSNKPIANVSQETSDPLIEAAKARDYDQLARLSTHNPEANKVMLGKYDNGGPTSYITKAGNEYTYYSMARWEEVKSIVGTGKMWKINKAFLNQQIALGKTFYASHNIAEATGFFARELNYLRKFGIKVFGL